VPRPWTMPPQRKQQWHQERQASAARTEVPFKQVHKEQVTKVEKQQPAASQKPAPQGVERKPVQDTPPPKAGAQGPPDPSPKHPGQKQVENPPPKHPPQEPSEKPKRGEKPKGEDKGDKKDKDDKRQR